jgi:hypothetical protein
MGEYEPDDSRIVTNVAAEAPGEPPRTGPREGEARARSSTHAAQRDESEKLEEKGKPTARDAAGEKQQGYKSDDDDEEEPPLGK